jgi:hypothetical protein
LCFNPVNEDATASICFSDAVVQAAIDAKRHHVVRDGHIEQRIDYKNHWHWPTLRERPELFVHSRRSLFFVTPPMCCLDVVWMIISPGTAHAFRILVVRHNIVVVGEFFVADRADSVLLRDFAVHQSPHLGRGT